MPPIFTSTRTKSAARRAFVAFCSLSLFCALSVPASAQNWQLYWSDEFDGAAGAVPDPANWSFDVGNNGGWGNQELEYYCAAGSNAAPCSAAAPNAYLDGNGNLVIAAIKSNGTWTSARLLTQSTFSFTYGRIEARMKLTVGNGLWPAFWMLGENIATVGWPTCGEADIMEWVDTYGASTTSATTHTALTGSEGVGVEYEFPNGGRIDDSGYHIYGLIWSPDLLQYYRDSPSNIILTVTPASLPADDVWAFGQPFFILLNQAIGGNWFAGPDATTPSPALMLVDYVRVYRSAAGGPAITALSPGAGAAGSTVKIGGTGFGATQGSSTVYFDSTPAKVSSWTDTAIDATVPAIPAGAAGVYVIVAGIESNAAGYSIAADPLYIDAGGPAAGTFIADSFYAGGTAASTTAAIDTSLIAAPVPPQAVYQSERYGPATYVIPGLAAGSSHTVVLHFAEIYWAAAGQRQFDVSINGTRVLSNFDIVAAAGAKDKAIEKAFTAEADSDGQIVVDFTTGAADLPKISAIAVDPPPYREALSVARSGVGTVTSSPAGIDCGGGCAAIFLSGAEVTLTAVPGAKEIFKGWSGACAGAKLTCSVTMNAAKKVSATFEPALETLAIAGTGKGAGTVRSTPAGIDCAAACSAGFKTGSSVVLTATAASGSTFAGWSGACSGTVPSCTVTMSAAKSVGAAFD